MATNDAQQNTNVPPLQEVRVDIGDLNNGNEFNHAHGAPNPGAPNHRVGAVRDRLFHAMVVKIAALSMLGTLIYVHYVYSRYPGTCLNNIKERWPRKGILRVEVISNLKQFESQFYGLKDSTKFNLRDILMRGPKAIPEEAKGGSILSTINFDFANNDDFALNDNDLLEIDLIIQPVFSYVVEYSLYHGLLKLPAHLRRDYKIEQMVYRIDGENDFCLLNWTTRFFTRHLIGVDDVIMSSLKALAENDTEKGFLRDLLTGEHYHFVTASVSKVSYLSAMLIMLLFTFAVSMLLRFSHHQIFLFILDLLQMFELNEPLVFPIAPLLTVILALVGIEAIMSEVFNDTSTAFYIILLVWMADQYDAICCRSSVSRRHWLRFFYLYHWAFYVYNYKYSGQYNVFALLTSSIMQ
ncbi:hypothetical protein M3Y98_00594400 [Aphelenchoides besseyi]|nr:hypothetical protein M3Y98_00594400 [Aphelenchoides besseyi]